MRALVVLTSCDKYPDESPTGYDLKEVAHAHSRWVAAGWAVEFASTLGTAVADAASLEAATLAGDKVSLAFEQDEALKALCAAPPKIADLLADEEAPPAAKYDVVYVAGGHGAMFDLPGSEEAKTLLKTMYEANKVVCACGEGSSALVGVDLSDGTKLLADKDCTGATNEEEEKAEKAALVATGSGPGSCQDTMGKPPEEGAEGTFAGGNFSCAAAGTEYVVTCGTLITGQNAASCDKLATSVLYCLDAVLAKFEPPRLALLAEREPLVAEVDTLKGEFEVGLGAAKQDEAAAAGKIEELQLKAVAKRDWLMGKVATIDAQLARLAVERQAFADELAAAAAAAAEE